MDSGTPTNSIVLPRGLILLASLWLVLSWITAIGFRAPLEATSASYTPGVRLMLMCTAIGLIVGWPLLRLSQRAQPFPIRQALLDLVVVLALLQMVVWPLRLVTPWSPARTAAIDATIAAWTILAGALVASAVGSDRAGPRSLTMVACLAMCVGGPILAWLILTLTAAAEPVHWLLRFGPLLEVHHLTDGGGAPLTVRQWHWIVVVAEAGVAAWCALAVVTALRNRRSQASTS